LLSLKNKLINSAKGGANFHLIVQFNQVMCV